MTINNVTEVGPEIFRIELPLPSPALKAVNAYVVRRQPRSLIIDVGLDSKACMAALSAGLGCHRSGSARGRLFHHPLSRRPFEPDHPSALGGNQGLSPPAGTGSPAVFHRPDAHRPAHGPARLSRHPRFNRPSAVFPRTGPIFKKGRSSITFIWRTAGASP